MRPSSSRSSPARPSCSLSDGLAEARDRHDHELGPTAWPTPCAVSPTAAPRDRRGGVLDAVTRFTDGVEASDDRTLVVIKACADGE
ncbi:MAG: hypothetical protein R2991_16820 [Thermoanaerobaculia bacterium]